MKWLHCIALPGIITPAPRPVGKLNSRIPVHGRIECLALKFSSNFFLRMDLREIRGIEQHVATFASTVIKCRILDALAHPQIEHGAGVIHDPWPHLRTSIECSQH